MIDLKNNLSEYIFKFGLLDPSLRGKHELTPVENNTALRKIYRHLEDAVLYNDGDPKALEADFYTILNKISIEHNLCVKQEEQQTPPLCFACKSYQYKKTISSNEVRRCDSFKVELTKDDLAKDCNQFIDKSLIP